jgi:hypothetical protein
LRSRGDGTVERNPHKIDDPFFPNFKGYPGHELQSHQEAAIAAAGEALRALRR